MADCYEPGTEGHKEAMADIAAFEKLQKRIFGSTENAFDARLEGVPLVKIQDIKRIMDEQKNETNH